MLPFEIPVSTSVSNPSIRRETGLQCLISPHVEQHTLVRQWQEEG